MAFFIMNISGKKIFISPLDWGLGHTTRCIPIIKVLQELGAKIWIGANKEQQTLLESELTDVNYLFFEGYNITYPAAKGMVLKMGLQIPKILSKIKTEKRELKKLIKQYQFDLIISDNRFGLYSETVPSIYITHQINIQAPFGLDKVLLELNQQYINKFTQCWIPDFSDTKQSLAGVLSRSNNKKYYYLGPLSRFNSPSTALKSEYSYTAIISGPEPQRTLFEKQVIQLFESKHEKCAIIGGQPLNNKIETKENIDYFPHLSSQQFYELVTISKKIICRPGYSSIMDLSILQKPVFFVPTPGQTEQEYLAKYYLQQYNIGTCLQQNILRSNNSFQFNLLPFQPNLNLKKRIKENLDLINS